MEKKQGLNKLLKLARLLSIINRFSIVLYVIFLICCFYFNEFSLYVLIINILWFIKYFLIETIKNYISQIYNHLKN